MRALGLPPRLRLIADWVPEGAYLADVGTDHGYLPTWLLLRGSIRGAIASDLRKGPLERAKATGRFTAWSGLTTAYVMAFPASGGLKWIPLSSQEWGARPCSPF